MFSSLKGMFNQIFYSLFYDLIDNLDNQNKTKEKMKINQIEIDIIESIWKTLNQKMVEFEQIERQKKNDRKQ